MDLRRENSDGSEDVEEFEELELEDDEEDENLRNSPLDTDCGIATHLSTHFGSIPFARIYDSSQSVTDSSDGFFVPGVPMCFKLLGFERDPRPSHMVHPNLYVIEVTHGDFVWVLKKRYKHFLELHTILKLFRASLALPLPNESHQMRRKSFFDDRAKRKEVPQFPKRPESILSSAQVQARGEQLVSYLNKVVKVANYRNHPKMTEFLEVSPYSFLNSTGPKGKEGAVSKRAGGHNPNSCFIYMKSVWYKICKRWRRRWLIAKDTYILYIHPKTGAVKSVILMDGRFRVHEDGRPTGSRSGVIISNLSRELLIDVWTKRQRMEWVKHIEELVKTRAKDFVAENRHGSYAPVRSRTLARWYVDGAMYMRAVANAIENAREEIFITDWWLSPELFLKRSHNKNNEDWRLDLLLRRKASSGVRIFIMLYKEVSSALAINSLYSKQKISTHPNIKVFRHPDHVNAAVYLWAHHEKLVIVDQKYAFLGGIDLCYGRWDDAGHRLTDLVPDENKRQGVCDESDVDEVDGYMVKPSCCVSETRFLNVAGPPHNFERCLVVPEYFDQAEGKIVNSKSPSDRVSRRLMLQRVKAKLKALRAFKHLHYLEGSTAEIMYEDPHSGYLNSQFECLEEEKLEPFVTDGTKYWIGKDYSNFIYKDVTNLEKPFDDHIDRTKIPRMPWHDIGAVVLGRAARDLARHFIQRWNSIKIQKAKKAKSYPWLIPKSYDSAEDIEGERCEELFGKLYRCEVQILRSASSWSAGISETENSIHSAYVDLILKAKHFIYIENQFFISLQSPDNIVYNEVADALFTRIVGAFKAKEKFRVYIVLPLLPAFEGEVGTPSGVSIQAITHWNYNSLCRGEYSLLERLKREVDDPKEYIGFYGLRKHDMLNGIPVTELIYVHSKLMIVDDVQAIIGSANINDRSLLGERDSEIAKVVSDQHFLRATFDGKPVKAGLYVSSLRRWIFREHLGIRDVEDPVADSFYSDVWKKIARRNTEIFEEVFKPLPTDCVKTFAELRAYSRVSPLAIEDPSAALEKLRDVQGHLVELPERFLEDENLTPAPTTKESLMPTRLWT
ncbi:phospholipase D2 [Galendromus occidentalis]|uniref:Phospholipase n=1 Tax=Galendromus occidentalis TaxID=34638 RepID=A0AAJ7L6J6_9ACAR|nr:phospholipase D2 [Galendromus occidentalis]